MANDGQVASPTDEYKDDGFDFEEVMTNMGESEAHIVDDSAIGGYKQQDVFAIVDEEADMKEMTNVVVGDESVYDDNFEPASPSIADTYSEIASPIASDTDVDQSIPGYQPIGAGEANTDEAVLEDEGVGAVHGDDDAVVDDATGDVEESINEDGGGVEESVYEDGGGVEDSVYEDGGGVEESINEDGGGVEESIHEDGGGVEESINEGSGEVEDSVYEDGGGVEESIHEDGGGVEESINKDGGNEELVHGVVASTDGSALQTQRNEASYRNTEKNKLDASGVDSADFTALKHQLRIALQEKEEAVRVREAREAENKSLEQQVSSLKHEVQAKDDALDELRSHLEAGSESDTIKEMQKSLDEKVKIAIKQGETNLELADRLHRCKVKLETEQDKVRSFRSYLVKEIAGPDEDPEKYSHISLEQLMRTKLSVLDYPDTLRVKSVIREAKEIQGETEDNTRKAPRASVSKGTLTASMETEIVMLKSRVKQLQSRLDEVETVRQAASGSIATANQLKQRNTELSKRLWNEKENRKRLEVELMKSGKRVSALSDHIEKIMVHLKHEAAAKVKASDASRRASKEQNMLKERNQLLVKRAKQREQHLAELREGSKLLEDQLRLMDDKYVELRTKLDWTRVTSSRELNKVKNEANKLRAKFALAVGNNPGLYHEIEKLTKGGKVAGPTSTKQKRQQGKGGRPNSSGMRPTTAILHSSAVIRPMTTAGHIPVATQSLGRRSSNHQELPAIEQIDATFEDVYEPQV